MPVPESLRKLAECFMQDISLLGSTPEEIIDFAAAHLDSQGRAIAKAYLSRLLEDSRSIDPLLSLWESLPAEIDFADGRQLRGFLSLLRDRL